MNKWAKELDQLTSSFTDRFGSLADSEISWKPHENTWSIAQNIDHLIVINESYFPILDQLANGTYRPPYHSRFGLLVSLMGNLVLRAVAPDRRKKTRTFPIWEPAVEPLTDDIMKRFCRHQDDLIRKIEKSEPLVKDGVVIASPAKNSIVYTLEKAFDIIVSHEWRHLNQATEVLHLLGKAAQSSSG